VPLSVLFLLLLSGCTGLKYASEERPLFTGYSVTWSTAPDVGSTDALRELEAVVTPQPNNSFLGRRPTVALRNMTKEPKKRKGLRHLLKYKIGSAAVYLDSVPLKDINAALVNRMNNRGYFAARSSFLVSHHGRKAVVEFTVTPGTPHLIRNIRVGDGTAVGLDSALATSVPDPRSIAGEPYDLANLIEDRKRAVDHLRDSGWFKLRAEDLEWATDTAAGDHRVDLHLRVKAITSTTKRLSYTIGSVTVHGDKDELLPPSDTLVIDGLGYVSYLGMYRPPTILRGVFIRPGQLYSLRRSDATQRYLNSYGVFKNVLLTYADDSARQGVLDASVTLLPQKRFSVFSELNAISQSNNFAGPGVKVGFRDRDLFRGAEQFTLDLNGNFETQINGTEGTTNAYELGIKAGLVIPRMLLLPFMRTTRGSVPTTKFEIGYGYFQRVGLYGLKSASAKTGYTWRSDHRSWHDLTVLEVAYNNLFNTSADFEVFLAENPAIRRSFEEELIVGFGYSYSRSTKQRSEQRTWLVFTLAGDEAGSILSVIYRGVEGPRPEEGYTLFNERFSQYVRLRPEVRWYQMIGGRGGIVVSRLLVHNAYAYGNSTVIPYVKQFYSGGTNSLRGFRARSVGPGSYVSDPSDDLQVDQVGDIKLEANVEYRFTMAGQMKGAFFADAGNVWLLRDDPQRPGGEFEWSRFISELALDAGFGLRYDPGVIVVRLDLAAPLRRPDLPAGDRWVFDDFDQKWSRNLILNFAIGYPF